ncbi:hypothetical protein ACPF8X_06835 [Streptomyces sp. G35A]
MPERLVTHMREVHTDVSEIGGAAAARARRVIPRHPSPAEPTHLPDRGWNAAARASARAADHRGRIAGGHDRMRIPRD